VVTQGEPRFLDPVFLGKFLDYPGQDGWGYCVFGKVVDGMEVVNKVKGLPTTSKFGHQDVPAQEIVIEKADIS